MLLADQAVMMRRLFDNLSAPDSVAVMRLTGDLLGYVPRRHVHRFVHDTNYGHVYAVNQDAAGLWRLTVSTNELGRPTRFVGFLPVFGVSETYVQSCPDGVD